MGRAFLAVVIVVMVVAAPSAAPALAQAGVEPQTHSFGNDPGSSLASPTGNFFFGGYIGVSYGDIEYIEIAPIAGYRFSENFGAGLGLLYRYRKDTRGVNDFAATDYGGNVFARYYLFEGLFTQAEYDYTSYEHPGNEGSGETDRSAYESFLLGAGYNTAIGRGAGVYFVAMYDFNYSATDPYRLYNSPIQLRIGISFGF